jgi:NRPS condensation-like uncharacterized protein
MEWKMPKRAYIPERFPVAVIEQLMNIVQIQHDSTIRGIIKFSGRIDAPRMDKAVRLTLDAEPVLGCRFVERKRRPYWQRITNIESCNPFSVMGSTGNDKELDEFMADPIDPLSGPLVRVGLFRSDVDTLCVKLHHMAADGAGIGRYGYLLAMIYRRLKEDGDYSPVPNIRNNRGIGRILKQIPPMQILKGCASFFYPRPVWSFPSTGQEPTGATFSRRRIEGERFDSLIAYCKREGVTVNDAILAAYYRAMFRIADVSENRFYPLEMTVDLRRHLSNGPEFSICNLSSAFYPSIRFNKNDRFRDTLSKTHAVMEKAKKRQPWIGSLVYLELVFKILGFSLAKRLFQAGMLREMASGKIHPYYANGGVIDTEQLRFDDAVISDAYSFGTVPYPPASLFVICTYKNKMEFTTTGCRDFVASHKMEEFLDEFLREIPCK